MVKSAKEKGRATSFSSLLLMEMELKKKNIKRTNTKPI
jgi:hypothetical protein